MWVRGIVLGLCLSSMMGAWAQGNAYPDGRDTFVPVKLGDGYGELPNARLSSANQVFIGNGKGKGYLYGADAGPGRWVNALSYYADVNGTGQLAGAVPSTTDPKKYRAAVTGRAGRNVQLLQGLDSYASSYAVAFSSNGRIAGNFQAPYLSNAFVTSPGSLVAIPIPMRQGGSQAYAHGVNASGQVAGTYEPSPGYPAAFVTSENGGQMIELRKSPGFVGMGVAYAINDAGQVVGCQEVASSVWKSYITDPATHVMRALDTPYPGCAYAINSEGRVAATQTSGDSITGSSAAIVTGRNGLGVYDLNDLVPVGSVSSPLVVAWRINDGGRVLVLAENGDQYLLIPKKPLP